MPTDDLARGFGFCGFLALPEGGLFIFLVELLPPRFWLWYSTLLKRYFDFFSLKFASTWGCLWNIREEGVGLRHYRGRGVVTRPYLICTSIWKNNKKMNPWKYSTHEKLSIFYPWKFALTGEKISKCTRENLGLHVKVFEKLPVKNSSHPWKKPERVQNAISRVAFIFTGKKHCNRRPLCPT